MITECTLLLSSSYKNWLTVSVIPAYGMMH